MPGPAQRLFGRTKIDSLDLDESAWYLSDTKVTATAAQLNALVNMIPASANVDVANDDVLFLDHNDSHKGKYDSFANLVTSVAGTATSTGLAATSGVLSATLGYTSALITVSEDDIAFIDHSASHAPKTTSVANVVTSMAGSGLTSTAGVLNTASYATTAIGGVFFTGAGDCDAVQVGAVLYTRNGAAADLPNGVWTSVSGTAAGCATSLAAAINGDTRNTGSTNYYNALVSGDGVLIYAKTTGAVGNVAVALTGAAPTQPSTLENLTGGTELAAKKTAIITRTVGAVDVLLAGFDVLVPFTPTRFIVQVRNSSGVLKSTVTDEFAIQAAPDRIHVTFAGATHIVATDLVTIYVSE